MQKNAPKKMATKPEPPTEKEVAAALLEFRNNAMVSTKHSTSIRVLTTRIGKKTIKKRRDLVFVDQVKPVSQKTKYKRMRNEDR